MKVETALSRLVEELRESLGANLVTLLLYGSSARPDPPRDARPDLLLVVREPRADVLVAAAPSLARWRRAGHKAPLVFGESEWRASADVFPLEIEDMRESHRLLAGGDPFAAVVTQREHMRAQLEREVRGKLLHVRAAWVANLDDGAALSELLAGTFSPVLALLRSALRLAGRPVPGEAAAVVQAAAELAEFDPTAFEWPLARRSGRKPAKLEPGDRRARAYVEALERLALWVDRL